MFMKLYAKNRYGLKLKNTRGSLIKIKSNFSKKIFSMLYHFAMMYPTTGNIVSYTLRETKLYSPYRYGFVSVGSGTPILF